MRLAPELAEALSRGTLPAMPPRPRFDPAADFADQVRATLAEPPAVPPPRRRPNRKERRRAWHFVKGTLHSRGIR